MTDQTESSLPKRVVRTITLTEEDLNMLDEVERVLSKTGHRVKTDSKLIRAAINVASRVLHGKSYDVNEIARRWSLPKQAHCEEKFLVCAFPNLRYNFLR